MPPTVADAWMVGFGHPGPAPRAVLWRIGWMSRDDRESPWFRPRYPIPRG